MEPSHQVTQLLSRIESGDPAAADRLLPLVYDELRKLAAARRARERPGQTLQATALVHEAYLRLVDPGTRVPRSWSANWLNFGRKYSKDETSVCSTRFRYASMARTACNRCHGRDFVLQQRPQKPGHVVLIHRQIAVCRLDALRVALDPPRKPLLVILAQFRCLNCSSESRHAHFATP